MASLYQIDERFETILEEGFDIETGEILEDYDWANALDNVSMELNKKIENIGAFYKNLLSDADQLKQEEDKLKKRRQVTLNKAERLKGYLDNYFKNTTNIKDFKKFETPKCVITYRKSTSLHIKDVNKVPDEYIKPRVIKETDIDKATIKKHMQNDPTEKNEYAELVENRNIQIK